MARRRRELRDPIHGFIHRNDLEQAIIDTPVFQRLRRIKQLAMAFLVYPGAVHTRFDHSIGAMHVAGEIADSLSLDPEDVRIVRLAALLHDIGHGPFSHVSEPVLTRFYNAEKIQAKPNQQIHELLTRDILLKDASLRRLISEVERERVVGVLEGSFGDQLLKSIVSGPLDADKQDYLLRDSYFCGVNYGTYDIGRLSETLTVRSDGYDRFLSLTRDGVHALEQFVLAKYYMSTQVYRHKIRLITDAMISRALELGITADNIGWLRDLFTYDGSGAFVERYTQWTDEQLVASLLHEGDTCDGYARKIFKNLKERKLHKRIAWFKIRDFEDPVLRQAISEMKPSDRTLLEKDIGNLLQVDPNLVIVDGYTIRSVRETARNTEASIIVLTPEGPRNFDEESTLFRSIDEAIQDQYMAVYAPITYPDETKKRQIQNQYSAEIKNLVIAFAQQTAGPQETKL